MRKRDYFYSMVIFLAFGLGMIIGARLDRQAVVAIMTAEHTGEIVRLGERLAIAETQRDEAMRWLTFVGLTTHYGDKEHGQLTSLGKAFSKFKLTAASKFLPYGTYWWVTNLENGKQVAVQITDDGPNITGRYLDLSEAAAKRLDMVRRGVVLTSMSPMIGRPGIGD
jgi:rare lipoprotein A